MAWLVLAGLGVAGPIVQAATPKYLQVFATFYGKGEYPMTDDDLAGPTQEWTLSHSYSGRTEVVIREIETSPPPNRRTQWLISPVNPGDGTSRIFGFIRDQAMNGYKEFGEHGSSAEHEGTETWSAGSHVNSEELGLELTIEPEAGTWGVKFAPGAAEAILAEKMSYSGKATRKPGPNGFGEAWQFLTGNSQDTTWAPGSGDAEQRGASSRYHPRGSVTLAGEIAGRSLVPGGTNFTGFAPIPLNVQLPGKGTLQLLFGWTLLDVLPEVELVVRSPRYWKWLPELSPLDGPGDPLGFVARIESPKGEDLGLIQVESMRWTLSETSREPGISVNYPINAAEADSGEPDLRIRGVPTDSEGQVGDEPEPEYGQSEIEIEPRDWGGWAVLRVEAKLKDGRVLKGRLETPPDPQGEYDIRLPLRDPRSKIARAWLQAEGVSGQEDQDDQDELPAGSPGFDGDGLSLYEEYRGFHAGGNHLRTSPRVKDLFIRNRARDLAAAPIRKFANISGLAVHLTLLNEFDPSLVSFQINRNRKDGPTRGPQAGLLVTSGGFRRPNDEIPPGTRPGDHIPVRVPERVGLLDHGGISADKARDHFVLQALFQSVAVRRPGPTDFNWLFIHKPQLPGSAQPPEFVRKQTRWDTVEEPVVVLDAAGADLAQVWNAKAQRQLDRELKKIPPGLPEDERSVRERRARASTVEHVWIVGERGGAHSGPEACLMRDWFAEVHASEFVGPGGRKVFRYIDPKDRQEKPGSVLGTTRDGTGVNAPNHRPESRYGPRSAPGPASEQMVVTDNP